MTNAHIIELTTKLHINNEWYEISIIHSVDVIANFLLIDRIIII